MRKLAWAAMTFVVAVPFMTAAKASSHREAPLISQDPLADNTDVYAFVSPERPDRVVLISNFIPLQFPSSGPNFWKFDDNVLYEIMIDNTGDAVEDITFQWQFRTEIRNPNTFLYNTGPVSSIDDPDLNVRQFFNLTRVVGPRRTGASTLLAANLHVLPAHVGVSSIREDYLRVASLLELSQPRRLVKVVLPAAAPAIVAGLRIAFGSALVAVVPAEMLLGELGVGYLTWIEWNNLDISGMLFAILVVGVVGLLLDASFTRLSRLVTYPE